MRVHAVCAIAGLLCGPAFGQAPAAAPTFDVADIHPSPRVTQSQLRGPFYTAGRYELRLATMQDLIRMAYNVDPEKVFGGPSWLEMDRFDVFAKVPAGSTVESRKLMLRELLADRFKLVAHTDNRPMPAYTLTVGKKSQLKQFDGAAEGCKFTVENNGPQPQVAPGEPRPPIKLPVIVYTCHITIAALASSLPEMPAVVQYFGSTPVVVDQTGLDGVWEFTFKYTPKVPPSIQVTGENISIFDAMEKQLGLKLEQGTVPLPVVVVDSVNQIPTPNSPETAKAFPPLPDEFEVAEIKVAVPPPPGARENGQQAEIKNGRVYVPGITLKSLIQVAWDLNGDEFLIGVPKWAESDKFDLIAKAPAGVAIGDLTPSRTAVPVNIDALRPMLRTLLIDRFKMQVHTEERQLPAYTLSASKPKLKKADPASRTKWQEGALPDSDKKNVNPSLGRLVTCQNMTMVQFAEMLPAIAPGYLRTNVTDATGLEGGWDFTFSFSPMGALQFSQGGAGEGGGGSAPAASTPNGAISLFDAMTKQLGLKLEQQKRPAKVLVVDHLEQKPVDN
jgi:uncharacterized protein (TIGR03435 family)